MARLCVVFCLHDDAHFLDVAIDSFRALGPVFVFVTKRSWVSPDGDWQMAERTAASAGATVITGDWGDEWSHRSYALRYVSEQGFTHAAIPDGDEVIESALVDALGAVAEWGLAERIYVERDTYWRTSEWVIRPREAFKPVMLLDIASTYHLGWRSYSGGRELHIGADAGIVHHLSYAGPPERIRRKFECWRQPDPHVPDWIERVWSAWEQNVLMTALHPTHPEAYGRAEAIPIPEPLSAISPKTFGYPLRRDHALPGRPCSWSVIIPLYGGEHHVCECLSSLSACGELIAEIVVVDNASPDDAGRIAATFPNVRVVSSPTNRGFAWACNRGLEETSGDSVLFLNSDTIPMKPALARLHETLHSRENVAMAGPISNYAGYSQSVTPTFSNLCTLAEFVEGVASSHAPDVATDMLVGFCLGVKRRFIHEHGGFDPRFTFGLWEDNDLSYRARRAGYDLLISRRSYVHHFGSSSFPRVNVNFQELFDANRELFVAKWRHDLDSGYASGLSGLSPEPIRFLR